MNKRMRARKRGEGCITEGATGTLGLAGMAGVIYEWVLRGRTEEGGNEQGTGYANNLSYSKLSAPMVASHLDSISSGSSFQAVLAHGLAQ
jgi:hypothetical protein